MGNAALIDQDAARMLREQEPKQTALESRMETIDEDLGKDSGNESPGETDSEPEDKLDTLSIETNSWIIMNVSGAKDNLKYLEKFLNARFEENQLEPIEFELQ